MSETAVKSGIGGKVREQQEFADKIVGLGEVKVILINPTEEEYKEILGIDLKEGSKATEYLGESKEGNKYLKVDIWVENVKNKKRDKITYFLEEKERTNKDETKKQYINNIGVCSWADDPNNLPDWFKGRDYRVAYNGEEDFYTCLRSWLGKLDYKDADTVLQLEWKNVMKGNLSLIKSQIGGEYETTFLALYTVKTVQKEGEEEVKEYQSIYNRSFLPTFSLKNFRLVDYDKDEIIENLKKKKSNTLKPHERFVLNVKGEYGCKDSYILKEFKTYNSEDFLVASNEPIQDEDSSY